MHVKDAAIGTAGTKENAMNATYQLAGRRALVTGGASGIGLASVEMLARAGARVALNHLGDDPRGRDAVARLRGEGLDVIGAPGNVSVAGEAEAMVARAIEELGGLDMLVNNAGTPGTREPLGITNIDGVTEELWQTILSTNLIGPFRCAHAAAPALRASRGAIVNTASIAGLAKGGSSMAYAASKAGLINLTINLARALAPQVRVNAVAPGYVESDWTSPWPQAIRSGAIDAAILKKACSPHDIAETILFLLAGPGIITAHTIVADAGMGL